MYEFMIRGSRGTIPKCGRDFQYYGGNTTCYSLSSEKGLIVFDAGTGISHVADEIAKMREVPPITLFFTHFHMDHVIGLPSFEPMYSKNVNINIMADPRRRGDWKKTLRTFMAKPYWPLGLSDANATMTLKDIPVSRDAMELYGVRISWFRVPHPQQCLAYRIEMPGKTVVIATDTEYDLSTISPAFVNFCRNTDFLIFDSHFTPEEYKTHRGWGHSSWETGARIAAYAGVGRLVLTHHSPSRKDAELRRIVKGARDLFPQTDLARENMILRKRRVIVSR